MTDQADPEADTRSFITIERPPSLGDHVRRVLQEDILAGRYSPGERLTEAMVMERTGVSRTPAREGMQLLQLEGLVKFERRRGTYIAYSLSPEEAMRIYDVRLVIEPFMTGRAAEHASPAELARLGRIVDQFNAGIDAELSSARLSRIDGELHGAIYEASRSDLVMVFRSYWSKLQLQLSKLVFTRRPPRTFAREHLDILEALQARDPDAASDRMASHIQSGKSTLEESFARKEAGE